MINVGQRTKSEDFESAIFVVLDHFFIDVDNGDIGKEQISLVIRPDVVLSVRERRSDLFEPIRRGCGSARRGSAAAEPATPTYALIDTVVDHIFPVLESIGDSMEEIEASLLRSRLPKTSRPCTS